MASDSRLSAGCGPSLACRQLCKGEVLQEGHLLSPRTDLHGRRVPGVEGLSAYEVLKLRCEKT